MCPSFLAFSVSVWISLSLSVSGSGCLCLCLCLVSGLVVCLCLWFSGGETARASAGQAGRRSRQCQPAPATAGGGVAPASEARRVAGLPRTVSLPGCPACAGCGVPSRPPSWCPLSLTGGLTPAAASGVTSRSAWCLVPTGPHPEQAPPPLPLPSPPPLPPPLGGLATVAYRELRGGVWLLELLLREGHLFFVWASVT